jgi:hypothetical protein
MRAALLLALVPVAAAACDPYQKRAGEFYAGPVDPAPFPAAYRAARYLASAATAHGEPAPYFAFPAASDAAVAPLAPPSAYVFDARCVPTGSYDARLDAYRPDEQGSVFTALPAAGYAPVVAEAPVTSNGEACQSIKSEAALLDSPNVVTHPADGKYLAWAIIDPSAEVRGSERLGWFDHYLVAYLDGGYLPTATVAMPDVPVVHAIAQNVYFPTQIPTGAGALGDGFDILDAARDDAGYSPLCHVFRFVPADPLHPPTSADDIDATTLEDSGTFVWCLQVAP